MNAFTKMSEKGQVVIPKDVRDRLRMSAGDRLEVIARSDGVFLRKTATKSGEDFDVITARIRSRLPTIERPTSVEEMHDAISTMWASGGPRWDQ